jgi:hypothetical protein
MSNQRLPPEQATRIVSSEAPNLKKIAVSCSNSDAILVVFALLIEIIEIRWFGAKRANSGFLQLRNNRIQKSTSPSCETPERHADQDRVSTSAPAL